MPNDFLGWLNVDLASQRGVLPPSLLPVGSIPLRSSTVIPFPRCKRDWSGRMAVRMKKWHCTQRTLSGLNGCLIICGVVRNGSVKDWGIGKWLKQNWELLVHIISFQARLDPDEPVPSGSASLHRSALSSKRQLDAQAGICLVAPCPRSTFLVAVIERMLSSIWTLVLITLKH